LLDNIDRAIHSFGDMSDCQYQLSNVAGLHRISLAVSARLMPVNASTRACVSERKRRPYLLKAGEPKGSEMIVSL